MSSQGLDAKKLGVNFNGLPPFPYGANYQSLLYITEERLWLMLAQFLKILNFLVILLSSRAAEYHLPDKARLQTHLNYRLN